MTRYIIKKAPSNKLCVEKRSGKFMSYLITSNSPLSIENAMKAEAERMTRLGLSFQVENRTNLFMDI